MNRLEYNERIYNYKHGLVNSAGSQTVKHNSVKEEEKPTEPEVKEEPQEQEEEIEHSALGDEWDKHKYIRKEEYGDGRVRYIYEDGSSQTINTGNAVKDTSKTGTPGGVNGPSLSPNAYLNQPQKDEANKKARIEEKLNVAKNEDKFELDFLEIIQNSPALQDHDLAVQEYEKYLVDPVKYAREFGVEPPVITNGTPGGVNGPSLTAGKFEEKMRSQATPTGLYGNTPKSISADTVNKVKIGSGATPTGVYGNGSSQISDRALAEARLAGNATPTGLYPATPVPKVNPDYAMQGRGTPGGVHGEAPKTTGDASMNRGTPGGSTGAKYSPIGDASLGKGTPGTATGAPAQPISNKVLDSAKTAQVWNNLKNAIKDAPQQQTEQPKEEPVITNGTPGGVNGPALEANPYAVKDPDIWTKIADEVTDIPVIPTYEDLRRDYLYKQNANNTERPLTDEQLQLMDSVMTMPEMDEYAKAIAKFIDNGLIVPNKWDKNVFTADFDLANPNMSAYDPALEELLNAALNAENVAKIFAENYGNEIGLDWFRIRYLLEMGYLRPLVENYLFQD